MHDDEFNNENVYKNIINSHIQGLQHVKTLNDYTEHITIKNTPLNDLYNRDNGLNRINM